MELSDIGTIARKVGGRARGLASNYPEALAGMKMRLPELARLPASMDFGETTAVVAMSLSLSFVAMLYPSWRAARLDPVEALRYE